MIDLKPPFRIANKTDDKELAELVNFAGEGMPLYIWQSMAADGEDPWELGRARQLNKVQDGQIVVADTGSGAVASLTGYVIGASPEPIGADFPAHFRPLQELENLAPNSWYVNVLACYPEQRSKGLGTQMLALAEEIAQASGLNRMSVIVADNNTGARRLYERQGYRETATRPCVKNGWKTLIDNWVLLMKKLS